MLGPVVVGEDNIKLACLNIANPGRFLLKAIIYEAILDFLPGLTSPRKEAGTWTTYEGYRIGIDCCVWCNCYQSTHVVTGRVFQSCRRRYNLRLPQSTETSTFYNTTFFVFYFRLNIAPFHETGMSQQRTAAADIHHSLR